MNERTTTEAKANFAEKENSFSNARESQSFKHIQSPAELINFLHKTYGNQMVERLLKSGVLQAKLKISQPNDVYEREADRVAEQVMKMPNPILQQQKKPEEEKEQTIQTKSSVNITSQIQRQVGKDKEEKIIQTKESVGQIPELSRDIKAKITGPRSGGQPLPRATLEFFEPRFGYDFSKVRVHTGTKAIESAKAVNALAYTVGRDIVFGNGQFSTETTKGNRLLAHELTHVIQQNNPNKQNVPVKGVSSSGMIQRYVSPLDILDYIGLGIDVGERIYLTHFYKDNDREFQLALNLLYTAIDGIMAILPGAGGGGIAVRASHQALAFAWSALPVSAQSKVIDEVAKGMSWTGIKTAQFINHLMHGEGGEKGGSQVPKPKGSLKRLDDKWLKRHGVNPHEVKKGLPGSISQFDIYKDSGDNLFALRKGASESTAEWLGHIDSFKQ